MGTGYIATGLAVLHAWNFFTTPFLWLIALYIRSGPGQTGNLHAFSVSKGSELCGDSVVKSFYFLFFILL